MVSVLLENGFEGGTHDGQITTTNSGATGDAFDSIVVNNTSANSGNAAWRYSTAAASHGSMGCLNTVGPNNYMRLSHSSHPGTRSVASYKFYYPGGTPSGQSNLISLRSASAALAYLVITTAGRLQAQGATAAGITASTSTAALSEGWHRIMLATVPGTDTTNGTIAWRLYDDDDVLIQEWSSSAQNAGTATAVQARFWGPSTWSDLTFLVDEIKLLGSDVTTDWITLSGDPAPVADLAGSGPFIMLDATGSTGIDLTYSLVRTSGPAVTPQLVSAGKWLIPQDPDDPTNWTVTATQADSQTATDTYIVPPASAGGSTVSRLVYSGTAWA